MDTIEAISLPEMAQTSSVVTTKTDHEDAPQTSSAVTTAIDHKDTPQTSQTSLAVTTATDHEDAPQTPSAVTTATDHEDALMTTQESPVDGSTDAINKKRKNSEVDSSASRDTKVPRLETDSVLEGVEDANPQDMEDANPQEVEDDSPQNAEDTELTVAVDTNEGNELQENGPTGDGEVAALEVGADEPQENEQVQNPTAVRALDNPVDFPVQGTNLGAPWTDKRGGLCEASGCFSSYQGGMFREKGRVLAILIDGECRARDFVGAEVIITTIAGGRELDTVTGSMVRKKDQKEDGYVSHLRQSMKENVAIQMVVGNQYPFFPVLLDHSYHLMGYFHCTDVWAEQSLYKAKRVKHYVCRLEKIRLGCTSWWIPSTTPKESPEGYAFPGEATPRVFVCKTCSVYTPQRFEQGWTCGNTNCEDFFKFPGGIDIDHDLTYAPEFLRQRINFEGDIDSVPDMVPDLPKEAYRVCKSEDGTEPSSHLRQGHTCEQCGCMSRRVHWRYWQCENELCRAIYNTKPKDLVSVASIREEENFFEKKRAARRNREVKKGMDTLPSDSHEIFKDAGIKRELQQVGGYETLQYLLPNSEGKIIGTVTVFKATEIMRAKANGPDDIYMEVQKAELPLKRNPIRAVGNKREVLTRHFAHNYGAPYKFAAAVESDGFDAADPVILKSVHRQDWAARNAIDVTARNVRGHEAVPGLDGNEHRAFNETLVIGYMAHDSISAHDDGEKDLGPTVATLSIGSPSVMKFYVKKDSGIVTENGKPKTSREQTRVLEFAVKHGDMVVMHGYGIQANYLHSVDPAGQLRFALTCRHIRHEMLSAADRTLAEIKGKIPEWSNQFAYHGEENSGSTF